MAININEKSQNQYVYDMHVKELSSLTAGDCVWGSEDHLSRGELHYYRLFNHICLKSVWLSYFLISVLYGLTLTITCISDRNICIIKKNGGLICVHAAEKRYAEFKSELCTDIHVDLQ